jgi:hypothetical protein
MTFKIEGSFDGETWKLFAYKGNEIEAREVAQNAFRKTKYFQIRIVEMKE